MAIIMFVAIIICVLAATILAWIRKKELRAQILNHEGGEHAQEEPLVESSSVKSKAQAVIDCFSIQTTLTRLFGSRKYSSEDSEFEVMNCVRVISLTMIVVGNSYFFMANGPVRNLEAKQQWIESFFFSFILQADLQSDIFYFITAFTWSFQMSKTLQLCGGKFHQPVWRIVLGRMVRFLPLYFLMIVFMWRIIPIYGGDGPLFYQFEDNHGCEATWFWHILFLNNLLPWRQSSKCLEQTWYLANDIQFFAILCGLLMLYFKNKKHYYIALGSLSCFCLLIQLITILTNDLVASYLADQDEYWSVYYYKPYTRMHGYLIGIFLGVEYFNYKYNRIVITVSEDENPAPPQKSKVEKICEALKNSKKNAIFSMLIGTLL